jgi:predicted RNA binding protein YcfA (HicA-like mRNA interferase family)
VKLPLISGEEMCKVAVKLGFKMVRQRGGHTIWQHTDGRTTTIPVHPGKTLPRGLTHKILGDLEITVEDYVKMK